MNTNSYLYLGDNLEVMKSLESESVDLAFIDPPFNTGKVQKRNRNEMSYDDSFDDLCEFLKPRVEEIHRLLKPNGSFYFHIDYREVHYCKVMIDTIFGRDNFLNEVIWTYDYGARTKKRWPAKHDNILFYAKDANNYKFNTDEVDRLPYMSPSLVGPEKTAFGKTPTDVFWITIVPTNSKEKTGYPTQKPVKLLERFILASSVAGDTVLDCFAGSGTTGYVAAKRGRNCVMIDQNPESIEVIKKRFDDDLISFIYEDRTSGD
jgi:site-specific DNA-methyltransferase (adenine-specific)